MSLKSERQDLAALVADATGFRVYPHVPGRTNVPQGMVTPGAPYLTREESFAIGRYEARYTLTLVVSARVNETGSEQVDDAVEEALVALLNAGYVVENVSEPVGIALNGVTYLGVVITTINQIQI